MRNESVRGWCLLSSYNLDKFWKLADSKLINLNERKDVVSGCSTECDQKCRFGHRSEAQSQSYRTGVPQSGEKKLLFQMSSSHILVTDAFLYI